MARVWIDTSALRPFNRATPVLISRVNAAIVANFNPRSAALAGVALSISALVIGVPTYFYAHFTVGLRSPVRMAFQSPLVISRRAPAVDTVQARSDQYHSLTAYQQYACQKFGSDCRIALAIQRVENPKGDCEIYHHNADGTLDWGYFQINTVHLKRPGVNLRDLLDCKKNIDFAYLLYRERGNFTAWTTYNSGAYRRALRN